MRAFRSVDPEASSSRRLTAATRRILRIVRLAKPEASRLRPAPGLCPHSLAWTGPKTFLHCDRKATVSSRLPATRWLRVTQAREPRNVRRQPAIAGHREPVKHVEPSSAAVRTNYESTPRALPLPKSLSTIFAASWRTFSSCERMCDSNTRNASDKVSCTSFSLAAALSAAPRTKYRPATPLRSHCD